MAGTVLKLLIPCFMSLPPKKYYYPPFKDEAPKAQRG